jgi:hypothetical protein
MTWTFGERRFHQTHPVMTWSPFSLTMGVDPLV